LQKDPTVDEEGFSIRPNNPLEAAFGILLLGFIRS